MRNYEVTFIIDPVLSAEEIKNTSDNYVDHLKGEGCEIVHVNDMGLRPLAYPIKKRSTGVYRCIEFKSDSSQLVKKLEIALKRDERVMRYLSIVLDKYGVKYNEDRRNGVIKAYKAKDRKEDKKDGKPAASPAPKAQSVASPAPKASSEEE